MGRVIGVPCLVGHSVGAREQAALAGRDCHASSAIHQRRRHLKLRRTSGFAGPQTGAYCVVQVKAAPAPCRGFGLPVGLTRPNEIDGRTQRPVGSIVTAVLGGIGC